MLHVLVAMMLSGTPVPLTLAQEALMLAFSCSLQPQACCAATFASKPCENVESGRRALVRAARYPHVTGDHGTSIGHTPGHVVLIHELSRRIWVGDVLFQGSIGRTDFPRGNHAQLMESIHTQLLLLDDDFAFVPGHGPESTIGHEKQHNPFLQ